MFALKALGNRLQRTNASFLIRFLIQGATSVALATAKSPLK